MSFFKFKCNKCEYNFQSFDTIFANKMCINCHKGNYQIIGHHPAREPLP